MKILKEDRIAPDNYIRIAMEDNRRLSVYSKDHADGDYVKRNPYDLTPMEYECIFEMVIEQHEELESRPEQKEERGLSRFCL